MSVVSFSDKYSNTLTEVQVRCWDSFTTRLLWCLDLFRTTGFCIKRCQKWSSGTQTIGINKVWRFSGCLCLWAHRAFALALILWHLQTFQMILGVNGSVLLCDPLFRPVVLLHLCAFMQFYDCLSGDSRSRSKFWSYWHLYFHPVWVHCSFFLRHL